MTAVDATRAHSAARCARRAPAASVGPGRARAQRGRSTRGSRSPRTRRHRPRAMASRTRGPRARPARAGARASRRRRRAARPPVPRWIGRSSRGDRGPPPRPRHPGPRSRRHRGPRHDAVGVARIGRIDRGAVGGAAIGADDHRHLERQRPIDGRQRIGQLRADGRAAQLQDRLVGESRQGAHRTYVVSRLGASGGASNVSSGTPRACS